MSPRADQHIWHPVACRQCEGELWRLYGIGTDPHDTYLRMGCAGCGHMVEGGFIDPGDLVQIESDRQRREKAAGALLASPSAPSASETPLPPTPAV